MSAYRFELRQLTKTPTAVVRANRRVADIGPFVDHAFGAVARVLTSQGIAPSGPPAVRYHRHEDGRFDVEARFPTAVSVVPEGDVGASSLPRGRAAALTYLGSYDELATAYGALADWVARQGTVPAGDPWEVHLVDPTQEPDPEQWETDIVLPVRA